MKLDRQPCTNCGTQVAGGTWWHLNNYYGVSGNFCPACYELVSHDPYDKPRHPLEYARIHNKLAPIQKFPYMGPKPRDYIPPPPPVLDHNKRPTGIKETE